VKPATGPVPIVIDQHYPPSFYASLLQVSVSTIVGVSGQAGRYQIGGGIEARQAH